MSSAMNRQETWQAFLQRWPIESLGALTHKPWRIWDTEAKHLLNKNCHLVANIED